MVVGGWVGVEEIGDKVSSFPRKASGFFLKKLTVILAVYPKPLKAAKVFISFVMTILIFPMLLAS